MVSRVILKKSPSRKSAATCARRRILGATCDVLLLGAAFDVLPLRTTSNVVPLRISFTVTVRLGDVFGTSAWVRTKSRFSEFRAYKSRMRLSNSVLFLDDRARRISCQDEDFFGDAIIGYPSAGGNVPNQTSSKYDSLPMCLTYFLTSARTKTPPHK